jgi:hypothetical protein
MGRTYSTHGRDERFILNLSERKRPTGKQTVRLSTKEGSVSGCCVHGNEPSGSIKCGELWTVLSVSQE